jgi:hypothetical protein
LEEVSRLERSYQRSHFVFDLPPVESESPDSSVTVASHSVRELRVRATLNPVCKVGGKQMEHAFKRSAIAAVLDPRAACVNWTSDKVFREAGANTCLNIKAMQE